MTASPTTASTATGTRHAAATATAPASPVIVPDTSHGAARAHGRPGEFLRFSLGREAGSVPSLGETLANKIFSFSTPNR
ncbi:MAG: hypothetical protein NTW21_44820 [Verrucomicrobia bacterium]|nr:hypothetical protein [Verrucomicrobiota bacterium]